MHYLIALCDLTDETKKKTQQTVIQNPCKYATSDNEGHQLEFLASVIQGTLLREGLGQSGVFFCAGSSLQYLGEDW